ncbi:SLOG family protein [Ruminococcus sp.]|uniref:SLOG family protein n=1 Tax=Ruminococcus sp. TaxID=41978 RepID=UPI0025EC6057|nr:SLOG family protein [Ruminococcus sp.]MBR1432760.1 DUF1273 family protein [Ruminococcus sp.]
MKTCCFTGHRIIKITPELVQMLKDTIIKLIERGVTDFYNGGAIGFDMLAAETVIALKAEYSDIKLHMLLPCPPEEQVKGWNKAKIARYNKILQTANSITVLAEHYTKECMKLRNERLVELADCCVCYCTNPRSGTGQTLRMAREKGIDVINLC